DCQGVLAAGRLALRVDGLLVAPDRQPEREREHEADQDARQSHLARRALGETHVGILCPVHSPIVLVHGFLDTPRTWDLVLPAIERGREAVAITLPGHSGGR